MIGMGTEAGGQPSAAATDADTIWASRRAPAVVASIFDRHFESVHAFARRRVGDDLAEEIASEPFARAFDQRERYDVTIADARPWLLGIAANLLRRHWRSERRRLAA
jgi:DNA-directed RNA polymerase specialized sigma24 family protein